MLEAILEKRETDKQVRDSVELGAYVIKPTEATGVRRPKSKQEDRRDKEKDRTDVTSEGEETTRHGVETELEEKSA